MEKAQKNSVVNVFKSELTDCKTKNSRHQVGGLYKTFLKLNINPDNGNIHLASHVARKQVISLKLIGVLSMLSSVTLDCHEFKFQVFPPVFFIKISTNRQGNKRINIEFVGYPGYLNPQITEKIMTSTIGDYSRSRNRL